MTSYKNVYYDSICFNYNFKIIESQKISAMRRHSMIMHVCFRLTLNILGCLKTCFFVLQWTKWYIYTSSPTYEGFILSQFLRFKWLTNYIVNNIQLVSFVKHCFNSCKDVHQNKIFKHVQKLMDQKNITKKCFCMVYKNGTPSVII